MSELINEQHMNASEPHTVSSGWPLALLVACPLCKRPRGESCRNSRGKDRWKPHLRRSKAALALPPGEGPRRNDKGNPLQVYRARQAADWGANALGWVAPDGTNEDDWAASGRPFPEESWP